MSKIVNVIVVAYFGDKWIEVCVNSLVKNLDRSHFITLIDNAGNTKLDRIDWQDVEHEIIQCPYPMGFAEANNFALVKTSKNADFYCFLNQDTQSTEDWVSKSTRELACSKSTAAITPLLRTYDDQGWDRYFLESAKKSREFRDAFDAQKFTKSIYSTQDIPAAAMIIRADVLQESGPFDPIYGSYYEDHDLCRRLQVLGYQVGVCPKASVRHFSGASSETEEASRRRARWLSRNRVIFKLRFSGESRPMALTRYLFNSFFRDLARSLVGTPSSKPLIPFIRAHLDLLRLLPRLLSTTYDTKLWRCYLDDIGWSTRVL